MSTYLLIDVSCLAHRAWHTTGGLSYQGDPTGVLFGVLRDIEQLRNQFTDDNSGLEYRSTCIFAFDSGGAGLRGQIEPSYKSNRRKELTEDEEIALQGYRQQVQRLYRELLPEMGFRNVSKVKGYEADDIIAYYAERMPVRHQGIIVSSDNDLWQCLRPNVSWYSPTKKQTITFASFKEEWGIYPSDWSRVKAIAGCSSDGVVGIRGVGEKTAVSWMRGQLKESSKKYQAIMHGLDIVSRNMELVKLPFEGLKLPKPRSDSLVESSQVYDKLGIKQGRTTASRRAMAKGFL